MKIWDVKTGRLLRSITVSAPGTYTVRMSGRGRYAVTSSSDGSLRAWNVKTGEEAGVIEAKIGYIHDYAFSRDGCFLAAPARGGITVWNLDTWKVERTLDGHKGGTTAVVFHPRGRFLASTGSDGKVRVWNLMTGREHKSFEAGPGAGPRIAWSLDGRRIVAPGGDGVIRIFGVK